MSARKPLAVGDRVAAYGVDERYTGQIIKVNSDGTLDVSTGGAEGICTFHPKQCRRLKPRAPKPAQEERIERWLGVYPTGIDTFDDEAQCDLNLHTGRKVHLVELRPGEVPISREVAERAWENRYLRFSYFVAALGLPEAP